MVRLHTAPDVWEIRGFLSAFECRHLILLASKDGRLKASGVGGASPRSGGRVRRISVPPTTPS
ncbi:hypothetical protein T484DRAFT_1825282 [Baffinella frigidus]|nr:hypothetical protein T484DRAFT_1825282 [Cryptophyta sp. CCMP2293]